MKEAITGQVLEFRRQIRDLLLERLLEAVEVVLAEELSQALGSESYERTAGRRGYRNGVEVRLDCFSGVVRSPGLGDDLAHSSSFSRTSLRARPRRSCLPRRLAAAG
jgi:hypothetical protein